MMATKTVMSQESPTSSAYAGTTKTIERMRDIWKTRSEGNDQHKDIQMSDKAANYIQQGVKIQIKMMKIMGWTLIIVGVPLMFLFVGFAIIPIGILLVWYAGRLQKKLTNGVIQSHLEGIGAVVGEIRKGSQGPASD